MSLLNESEEKYMFKPTLSHSHRLKASNTRPFYLQNNMNRERTFMEVNVDKFAQLTNNQSQETKSIDLKGLEHGKNKPTLRSFNTNNTEQMPKATLITNYKWNPAKMPELRIINKTDENVPQQIAESEADRKKRLVFEQKVEIEHKLIEKGLRQLRAYELAARSSMVAQNNRLRRSLSQSVEAPTGKSNDKWGSINANDIQLKKEIIEHFYSMDNRSIRCFRPTRPDFFKLLRNDCFDKLEQETLAKEKISARPN